MVAQEHGMVDGQRPKRGVCDCWPMNGSMEHCSSDSHYRSNILLRNAVVVMCTNAGKPHDLCKRCEVASKLSGREDLGIVCQVLLWYDSILTTGKFELLFRFECLVRVEVDLEFDMDETGGVVHEDATSRVHLVGFGLPSGGKKSSSRAADEVIDGDSMSGNNVVGFEDVCSVANDG
jgi:hypothetical protein